MEKGARHLSTRSGAAARGRRESEAHFANFHAVSCKLRLLQASRDGGKNFKYCFCHQVTRTHVYIMPWCAAVSLRHPSHEPLPCVLQKWNYTAIFNMGCLFIRARVASYCKSKWRTELISFFLECEESTYIHRHTLQRREPKRHTHPHTHIEREKDSVGSICDQPNKHVLLDPTVYHDGASVLLLA